MPAGYVDYRVVTHAWAARAQRPSKRCRWHVAAATRRYTAPYCIGMAYDARVPMTPCDPGRLTVAASAFPPAPIRFPDQCRLMGGATYAYVPDEYNRARIVEKVSSADTRAMTCGCRRAPSQLR